MCTSVAMWKVFCVKKNKDLSRLLILLFSLGNSNRASIQPPPPPKRDPSTTLSVGRARARSMVANMAALEALDKAINEHDSSTSESVTGSVDSVQRMPDLLVESTNNTQSMNYKTHWFEIINGEISKKQLLGTLK